MNRALFQYEVAKQAGKGVPAAAPAYFLKATGGALGGKRTQGQQLVGDGLVFSKGFQWIDSIEAGGQLNIISQPSAVALMLLSILGTDQVSGAGDPYTHALTPNNTSGGTLWFTFWKRVDSIWELYPDCKVTELTLDCSTERRAMLITAQIMGASRPQSIAAPSSAAEETVAFNWNHAKGYWCVDGDYTNLCLLSKATDLTTAIALANNIKTKYTAHIGASHASIPPHGKAQDAANTIAAAVASDQASLNTLLNEMKGDFNAHRIDVSAHYFTDTTYTVTAANATTLATSLVLVNDILQAYNGHVGKAGSIREFSVKITRGFEAWRGEDVVPHDIIEGRGLVETSFTLLLENTKLYNRIMYGNPYPTAGSEVTSEIITGSFHSKFDMGVTPARSVEIIIPQVQYKAEDISENIAGDPAGSPMGYTINGEAGGTAPIITCNVVNGVAAY